MDQDFLLNLLKISPTQVIVISGFSWTAIRLSHQKGLPVEQIKILELPNSEIKKLSCSIWGETKLKRLHDLLKLSLKQRENIIVKDYFMERKWGTPLFFKSFKKWKKKVLNSFVIILARVKCFAFKKKSLNLCFFFLNIYRLLFNFKCLFFVFFSILF